MQPQKEDISQLDESNRFALLSSSLSREDECLLVVDQFLSWSDALFVTL